ncbi:hypothetical protein A3840_14835 [Devosia elaeis]|uniref:Uncharacterized protein n=2 Tax=Devosia elaeis TaxID=1770058 RepID=A0A178HRC6_9HYPH|nr:hypothetical protein A3840_14835 [Devosia elaeis]
MGFLENVAIQWLIRRVPELVGLITVTASLIAAIPPEHMATIMAILTGQGGGLTVTALIGLGVWVYAQIISFRQTTKPKQVEQIGGKPVEISSGRKSLVDILAGK